METNVQVPVRRFFQSREYIQNVSKQEQLLLKPVFLKLSLFVCLSVLFSGTLGMVGYNSEEISKLLAQSPESIEALQFFHVLGLGIQGLLTPIFYLLLSVLLSYFLLKELKIGTLLHIHLLFIWFILLNQLIELAVFYFFGIPAISSPISLGIVAQILLDHPLFIHFFSQINLVYIGGLVYLVSILQTVSTKKKAELIMVVLVVHLIIAIASAGISVINIEALLNG
ncbi:hypothetical protein [Bacillus sp. AK128]